MADKINIDESQRLTGKQLSKIIEDFARGSKQYLLNRAYYEGKNPEVIAEGAFKRLNRVNPNNVIPLPFARRTINDLQGYAYKPGNVKYQFDTEQDESTVEMIKEILQENDEPIVSSEIFQDAAINGEGAELIYIADEQIQFAKVPREQVIFRYVDTIKQDKLELSIRYYDDIEVLPDGKDQITHHAEVYTDTRIDFYKWVEKRDITQVNQQIGQEVYTSNFEKDYVYIESRLHPFGSVPLYPYNINDDKLGVYQASISIINKLDGFGSDSIANAIDQFNDTILLLSKKISEISKDESRNFKVFDDLGTEGDFVQFLQRNLDIDATIEATKMFERWYYELTGIPNLNDEKFGVKSGIAIAYALVSFENLVTTMETYFTRGLKYRLELINNALMFLNRISEPVQATIEWQRNLPFDLRERSEIIEILTRSGIVTKETMLKLLPETVVADPLLEINNKREEAKEEIASMQDKMSLMVKEPKQDIDDEEN